MSVSLTVPLESNALRHAIKMLQGMENDLHSTPVLPEFCQTANAIADLTRELHSGAPTYVVLTEADAIADLSGQPRPDNSTQHIVAPSYIDPSQAFATTQSDVPPPPPPATTGEVDSEGMPWDGRIHTSAHTKVANGTWKLARGVDKELVEAIKAEHLGNATSVIMTNVNTAEQPVEPITNVPPPPPPSADESARDPVRVFMSDIAKAGRMPSEINVALQKHGVQTLQLIRNFPEKIPAIRLELGL